MMNVRTGISVSTAGDAWGKCVATDYLADTAAIPIPGMGLEVLVRIGASHPVMLEALGGTVVDADMPHIITIHDGCNDWYFDGHQKRPHQNIIFGNGVSGGYGHYDAGRTNLSTIAQNGCGNPQSGHNGVTWKYDLNDGDYPTRLP